jgi:hypothetical protein
MLYRFIRKTYNRKNDVLVLRRILEGVYPYRIEQRGTTWVLTTVVSDLDYLDLKKCL